MEAKNLGAGKRFDVQDLMLVKQRKDAGKWILRLVIDGRRWEMSLGHGPVLPIAEAGEHVSEPRRLVRNGDDPTASREAAKRKSKRDIVKGAIAFRRDTAG